MFGSQITPVALPLIAAITLQATPAQMALLQTLQYTPAILLGLVAGVWVDRVRRRPIMIFSDLARAFLLLSIPLLAWFGLLRIELLYLLTFLLGIGGLFFGVADAALLPHLVRPAQLVAANSALATSSSVARIAGPGIAGILIQWLSAPFAPIFDAVSFLASAWAAYAIRAQEPPPPAPEARPGLWRAVGEGLRTIIAHPVVRALTLASMTFDLFWNALYAVYVLYLARTLGLAPAALGLILAIGSIGALVGTLVVGQVHRRFGIGRSLVGAQFLIGSASLLIPLALFWPALSLVFLIAAELVQSCVGTIYGITRFSLTQAITPNLLRGRVQASSSFIGMIPTVLGSLLGGLLGESLGIVATLSIGAAGGLLGFLWLVFSPVRRLRELP